jgi:hypothetical protein
MSHPFHHEGAKHTKVKAFVSVRVLRGKTKPPSVISGRRALVVPPDFQLLIIGYWLMRMINQ